MATFSAAPQALGYLYQARAALFLLLQSHEDAVLRVEALDDIELTGAAEPKSPTLVQLKHHTVSNNLKNSSSDLWKSIRVWSEQFVSNSFSLGTTCIALFTTSSEPSGTCVLGARLAQAISAAYRPV